MKWIKTGLVALFLSTTAAVFGQQTPPGPIDPLGPQNTTLTGTTARGDLFDPTITNFDNEIANSILFFNPEQANQFTLRASAIEDHEDDRGLSFTHYAWRYSADEGDTYSSIGTDAPTLSQTGLSPGYHYFQVEARIVPTGTDPDLTCGPDNVETFVVFVLPPLAVTPTNSATTPLLQYCEADAATQDNITLSAGVAYDMDMYAGNPAVAGFEFNYRWYYVKSTHPTDPFSRDNADFATIDPTKADITEATLISGATDATYTPAIDEIGTYKFFVEVEYQIKDRSIRPDGTMNPDDPTDRNRPYVIYRGWLGGDGQANASIVTITPAPGRPHITIEGVID